MLPAAQNNLFDAEDVDIFSILPVLVCSGVPAHLQAKAMTSHQKVRPPFPGGRRLFPHNSPNRRRSSLTDRPPERRGVFRWTSFWVQLSSISGQLPVTEAHSTRWRKSDAGSRRLHDFGCFHRCVGVWFVWYPGVIEQIEDGVASAEQRQLCTRFYRGATLDWGVCFTFEDYTGWLKSIMISAVAHARVFYLQWVHPKLNGLWLK